MLHLREWGVRNKGGVQRLQGALDVQILVGHTVGRTHARPILGIPRTGSGCLVTKTWHSKDLQRSRPRVQKRQRKSHGTTWRCFRAG